MKKLYFVRHGLSEYNEQKRFAGHADTPLTDAGRAQAKAAGQKAAAEGIEIDLILTSPLSRAAETAEIIAEEIGYPKSKIIIEPSLIERSYGPIEGRAYDSVEDIESSEGIETIPILLERAKKVIDHLHTIEKDNVLIVCHGSIGRALRHHILPDAEFDPEGHVPNAEIIRWI